MDVGTLPQWITAVIAIAAGGIAIWNINSQRAIARRRAAFDLFLKTETDDKMLTAYDNFHKGINAMKAAPNIDEFCTSEATREHYLCIRKYLNVHELVAVGIRERVLHKDVCYAYWADTLMNNYGDAKPVLNFVRNRPRNKYTYDDLEKINKEWTERKTSGFVTFASDRVEAVPNLAPYSRDSVESGLHLFRPR
jgi:hypothetical protein